MRSQLIQTSKRLTWQSRLACRLAVSAPQLVWQNSRLGYESSTSLQTPLRSDFYER
jgi:hypothetical protein